MTDAEKTQDWVRYISGLRYGKFPALQAALRLDPKLLPEILKQLKMKTAEDVVKGCE